MIYEKLHATFKPDSMSQLGNEIRMYFRSDRHFTYDDFLKVSVIAKTTNINYFFDSGFQGSDVTPGIPAEFAIVITF